MRWQSELCFDVSTRLTLLAAPAGESRRGHIQWWLDQAKRQGHSIWMLPCDRRLGGPWAGLSDLFEDLAQRLQSAAPDLLAEHDYELTIAVPGLQRTIQIRNQNLTDLSSESERTRIYPTDRAYRIVHGLIDLLAEAQQVLGDPGYVLACDDVDHAGPLVQRFLSELMRRKGNRMGLNVLVAVEPSSSDVAMCHFSALECGVRIEVAIPQPSDLTPREMGQRAQELERQSERDAFERQSLLPRLIHAWLSSDQPARALPYQIEALVLCGKHGLYEDALFYGEQALEALEQHSPDAAMDRMNIYLKLYGSYISLNRPKDAQRVTEAAMSHTDGPKMLGQWRYMNAMLHARYLPQRDLDQAQRDLDQGMSDLEQSDFAPHLRDFLVVFNRNGLALVRHLQGRPAEAIALCEWGYTHLASQLSSQEHRLHRSVLIYNIALVYNAIGNSEEAIRYISEAIGADPKYSEYYNDRGSMYFKLEKYDAAIADYLHAIELSPPYMEVWTNLGQCYKAVGRLADAIAAYSRALDLDPKASLALAGRAQAYDGLGNSTNALADYDALLALSPSQPVVLANRATLHYECGRIDRALEDLDRAITLAPEMADLYESRAVALRAMGRVDMATHDDVTAARLAAKTKMD